MMNCPHCDRLLQKTDYKFCPFCGWQLDTNSPNTRRADFEIGRIDALNTIKEDLKKSFLKYMPVMTGFIAFLSVSLALLGIFGIQELVSNRVYRAVDDKLEKIQIGLKSMIDIFPIIENDFYRIKSIKTTLQVIAPKDVADTIEAWRLNYSPRFLVRLTSEKYIIDLIEFTMENISSESIDISFDTDFPWKSNKFEHGDTSGRNRITYEELLNKQIDILKDFIFLELKIYFHDYDDYIKSFLNRLKNNIEEIKINIVINKTPLWNFNIKSKEINKDKDGEYYIANFNLKNEFKDSETIKRDYREIMRRESKKYDSALHVRP